MFVNHISPDLDLIYSCVPISSFMGHAKSCVYHAMSLLVFTHIHGYSCARKDWRYQRGKQKP